MTQLQATDLQQNPHLFNREIALKDDVALLARLQVEELVRSEPERVSEILAQWAADELASAGAGR